MSIICKAEISDDYEEEFFENILSILVNSLLKYNKDKTFKYIDEDKKKNSMLYKGLEYIFIRNSHGEELPINRTSFWRRRHINPKKYIKLKDICKYIMLELDNEEDMRYWIVIYMDIDKESKWLYQRSMNIIIEYIKNYEFTISNWGCTYYYNFDLSDRLIKSEIKKVRKRLELKLLEKYATEYSKELEKEENAEDNLQILKIGHISDITYKMRIEEIFCVKYKPVYRKISGDKFRTCYNILLNKIETKNSKGKKVKTIIVIEDKKRYKYVDYYQIGMVVKFLVLNTKNTYYYDKNKKS